MQLNINSLSKKEFLMNRTRFTLVAGMLLATAFVFSCGDEPGEEPSSNTENICGGLPFIPSSQFCYAEQSFNKCNGNMYNPLDSFCFGNVLYKKCGGMNWDPIVEFCSPDGKKLYPKCNNNTYNPVDFYCDGSTVTPYMKCNGISYNSNSFCDSDKIYEKCSGATYTPSTEFCLDGVPVPKCNGNEFDSGNFCTSTNEVYKKCMHKEVCSVRVSAPYEICSSTPLPSGSYNPLTHFCYSGQGGMKLVGKCNGKEYDFETNFCYNGGKIIERCGTLTFDTLTQFCSGSKIERYEYCGSGSSSIRYNPFIQFCAGADTLSLCNSEPYNPLQNFCNDNKLYPRCGGKDYIPSDVGCFETKLYPLCTASGTLGICVHNTVLRCKQAGGSGEEYTVKPYPGMKCLDSSDRYNSKYLKYFAGEYRGKIVGDITYGSRSYSTIQIGEQVWMAENLANGNNYLFYWGGDTGACKGCPDDRNNTLTTVSYANRKGSCPNGWRIPSSKDWQDLIRYAGGNIIAGNRLKSTSDWGQGNGLDNYGFNAKPLQFKADIPSPLSTLNALGAFWWTSTTSAEPNTHMAKFWYVISSDTEAEELAYEKEFFQFSVRCLQNIE